MPAPNGILLVDKPAGMSSADVTNRLKRAHRLSKIGHGGTLDPFATGLLVVLLGDATKVARFLLEGEKEYLALAELGNETDTGDHTGTVVHSSAVPARSREEWQSLTAPFTGMIRQTPPAYSAVKIKGRPLYDYARKGEEAAAKPREVIVSQFEILEAEGNSLRFRVRCSGGTYIRVLAADLARAGGTHAHLRELRRTTSSSFRVEDAHPLEDLLARSELPVINVIHALSHLPRVTCTEEQVRKVRQGNLQVFDALRDQIEKPGYFLLVDSGGQAPVAIANHHPMLRPSCTIERVFDPHSPDT
jgi:tRNA pseudouridine55 synthase